MSIIKGEMTGDFCLSQRWESYSLEKLFTAMEKYKKQYPPQGYSTRFIKPRYDRDSNSWITVMYRDRSCD